MQDRKQRVSRTQKAHPDGCAFRVRREGGCSAVSGMRGNAEGVRGTAQVGTGGAGRGGEGRHVGVSGIPVDGGGWREGAGGWEVKAREAGENQKHAPMGVLLVFERCWLGGNGEGSRRKPETRPHGRASDLREVESRPTPKMRAFGFREVKSRPTPKTHPHGRVLGVGLEGMGRGRKAHQRVETQNGGLLLVTEALCFMFRHDSGRGGQKHPTVASKREGEVLWALEGSADAEQKKCAIQGTFFLFGGWKDMLVGLGTCQWGLGTCQWVWGCIGGAGNVLGGGVTSQ